MTARLLLPDAEGSLLAYTPRGEPLPDSTGPAPLSRVAFAAVHIVGESVATVASSDPPVLDWDATLRFRHHLWAHGLAVAEAMDTAQRGMGLDWATTQILIARSCSEGRAVGARIACGAGTDHMTSGEPATLDEILAAYEHQVAHVEDSGGQVILMASRQLASAARSPEDYRKVYGRVLDQVSSPVILHWLGPMFDPALAGYWGHHDPRDAAGVVLALIGDHRDKVDGIKISLLDRDLEVDLRRRLPEGVRLYTGDDFNYQELIEGDERGHSDALLGIFDAIAPAAAAALRALDSGDLDQYRRILAPTVPLSRHLFAPPTFNYKTGIVFLAYLNGHQSDFRMIGGLESARPISHLARAFVLADEAGLLADPELAAERMRILLASAGVGA